jgi:hypothetical protein
MTNEEFAQVVERIQKAIITTSDLAGGGLLLPEQADKFIDYVVDLSGLKDIVRIERFRNEQMQIDKIGVHTRVAMPAVEATDPVTRRGVNTDKILLQPKETIIPFELSRSFVENNIEGDDIEDKIVRMMSAQGANDHELLAIAGDVLGAAITEHDYLDSGSTTDVVKDGFMGLGDGWMRKADSGQLLDVENTSISPTVFSDMLNAMPEKYKKDPSKLMFICSRSLEQLYRRKVGTRETNEGDIAINNLKPLTPFGVPLVPFPLFPYTTEVVEHVALTGTDVIPLRYKPIDEGSEVVVLATLDATPITPFIEGTDYHMDYTLGTIQRDAGGAIGAGVTVKVTYDCLPQIILCDPMNLIWAIGRDISIDTDKNIFKRVKQWAITMKVDMNVENTDAIVKAYNISKSVS